LAHVPTVPPPNVRALLDSIVDAELQRWHSEF
jgi:hypothetical protein